MNKAEGDVLASFRVHFLFEALDSLSIIITG